MHFSHILENMAVRKSGLMFFVFENNSLQNAELKCAFLKCGLR